MQLRGDCRGARAQAVARLGAMASAASGSSNYGDTRKGRMRAEVRTSGASELREHDRGDPERGHASTTRLNSTAQLNSKIAGALRARGRHGSAENYGCLHAMGRMGEGVALPSSPKDAKWSTETSWRRRIGALNLGAFLTERKEEAGDVEELVVRGTVVDVVEGGRHDMRG